MSKLAEPQVEAEVEPLLDLPPSHWPPVAHLIRREDHPPKEGTIALCGAKLMGIDLHKTNVGKVCDECKRIAREESEAKYGRLGLE